MPSSHPRQSFKVKTGSRQPRLFVGSSTEGLNIAYAVQENLEFDAETTVWKQGVFKPTRQTLADLVAVMQSTDFAAFIFNADDLLTLRGKNYQATRDNVIFELGLFIGHLGADRCFFIQPRGLDQLHLPSDLLGLTALSFKPDRSDGNLVAALGTACNQIRRSMREAAFTGIGEATPDAELPEAAEQKLERLIALWESDTLKGDRALVSKGMPMWIGDDEDGQATAAFERICTFLNAVADTIMGNPRLEVTGRPIFEKVIRSVWSLAQSYFVNAAHSSRDEHWENRTFPPMKELAERWSVAA